MNGLPLLRKESHLRIFFMDMLMDPNISGGNISVGNLTVGNLTVENLIENLIDIKWEFFAIFFKIFARYKVGRYKVGI